MVAIMYYLLISGYNSRLGSRDRLSNLSLSDPDLYAKVELNNDLT